MPKTWSLLSALGQSEGLLLPARVKVKSRKDKKAFTAAITASRSRKWKWESKKMEPYPWTVKVLTSLSNLHL